MIAELDIYRAAGSDAVIEVVRMVARMLELSDLQGRVLWQRIRHAIEVLQALRKELGIDFWLLHLCEPGGAQSNVPRANSAACNAAGMVLAR